MSGTQSNGAVDDGHWTPEKTADLSAELDALVEKDKKMRDVDTTDDRLDTEDGSMSNQASDDANENRSAILGYNTQSQFSQPSGTLFQYSNNTSPPFQASHLPTATSATLRESASPTATFTPSVAGHATENQTTSNSGVIWTDEVCLRSENTVLRQRNAELEATNRTRGKLDKIIYKLRGEKAQLEKDLEAASDRELKLDTDVNNSLKRVKELETKSKKDETAHTHELEQLTKLVKVKDNLLQESTAKEKALEVEKKVWEAEKRAWKIEKENLTAQRKSEERRGEVEKDAFAEADEFRRQILRAKETTWFMIQDRSVQDWVPDAADTIEYQYRQLIELKNKVKHLEARSCTARNLTFDQTEYSILEDKLTKTIIQKTSALKDVQSRLLATAYLPLTRDEIKDYMIAYDKSNAILKAQMSTPCKEIHSSVSKLNNNIPKPEPVPDPKNPSTFGLFYDEFSDSESEADDTIADIPTLDTESNTTAVPSEPASVATKNKGFLYYVAACWKSRKLIFAAMLIFLLVIFDIYRVFAPDTTLRPSSPHPESILNDKEVILEDLQIKWTSGIPSFANEAPAVTIQVPEYEIISYHDEPQPTWNVVREVGYDLNPENTPEPPVISGVVGGTLAVLSAGILAADSYTWVMGLRGANPR